MKEIVIYGCECEKFFELVGNVKTINRKHDDILVKIVTNKKEIAEKGFTNLPVLLINNVLVSQGKCLSREDIEKELF